MTKQARASTPVQPRAGEKTGLEIFTKKDTKNTKEKTLSFCSFFVTFVPFVVSLCVLKASVWLRGAWG